MTSARPTFSRHLRNLFLGGLVVVVPIVLTVNALVWLFRFVDGLAGPLTEAVLGRPVPGIGFATTVAVVFLAGFLFSFGPLKKLLVAAEQLLDAVPVVGVVYGTTKKVFSGIGGPGSGNAFKRFVLARLPGRTTPGFLTGTFTLKRSDGSRARGVHRLRPHQPPLRGRRGGAARDGRDRDGPLGRGRGEPDAVRGRVGPAGGERAVGGAGARRRKPCRTRRGGPS